MPGAVTPAVVPAASAALVGAIDISSVSGLDLVGLENVLTFGDDRPGGVFSTMLLPRRSPLVGASPGFSSP